MDPNGSVVDMDTSDTWLEPPNRMSMKMDGNKHLQSAEKKGHLLWEMFVCCMQMRSEEE